MSIYLSRIKLKNFRCFTQYEAVFENPVALIEGVNGAGKTSLLEALYYTCYLRSFRSHSPKDLIQAGHESFFVQVDVHDQIDLVPHAIQIGFARNRRLVKIDEKPIASYKDLVHSYRVVSVTEDDLELIKEGPTARRTFIDQAVVLLRPEFATTIREYHHLVEQRNAALNRFSRVDQETYAILTSQVWLKAREIIEARRQVLSQLSDRVEQILRVYFHDNVDVSTSYQQRKGLGETVEEFRNAYPDLYEQERRFERTLFGPHVDDIQILMGGAPARQFASRGQQKLIVVLFKIAVAQILADAGFNAILLLDDFMTDFDKPRASKLLDVIGDLSCQLVVTSPVEGGVLADRLAHGQRLSLVSITG